jgi:hypothetical protein
MDEVLVPVIKEEPNSDSEADPLSSGIDLRKVKVGYVKKFATCQYSKRIYEWSVPISYILDTYFLPIFISQSCLHGYVTPGLLIMLSGKLSELTQTAMNIEVPSTLLPPMKF